jgi:hypothetical protein
MSAVVTIQPVRIWALGMSSHWSQSNCGTGGIDEGSDGYRLRSVWHTSIFEKKPSHSTCLAAIARAKLPR